MNKVLKMDEIDKQIILLVQKKPYITHYQILIFTPWTNLYSIMKIIITLLTIKCTKLSYKQRINKYNVELLVNNVDPIKKNFKEDFKKDLIQINRIKTDEIINQAKEQYQPIQIVDDLISPTLQNIGDKWEKGIISLASFIYESYNYVILKKIKSLKYHHNTQQKI